MFGGNIWGSGIGGGEDHSDRERDPPPPPTRLEFPSYTPPFVSRRLDAVASSKARDRICHVRSFTEITDEDLSHFNIDFKHDTDISEFFPPGVLDSRPFFFDDDLDAMLEEITVGNQDAFREILRMEPLPGRSRPRLAYARNFFGSLEDVARYWDTSLDHYYTVAAKEKDSSHDGGTEHSPAAIVSNKSEANHQSIQSHDVDMIDHDSNGSTNHEVKEVYKGYRFGNGDQCSPGVRVALVKNLLKMVTHKFSCRDHEPIPGPREKLHIRGVRVQSVQYQFCIARVPKEVKLARSRMVEGPVVAVHCREETRFKQTPNIESASALLSASSEQQSTASVAKKPTAPRHGSSAAGFVGERFDLFREVGCMLILASQREREGKDKASYSGQANWWVTEKRWGGGPTKWGQLASEVFEDDDPSWGPEEKKLQEQKRVREIEERNRSKDAKELLASTIPSVDELMANNAPTLPAIPGEPLTGPRKKKLRSLERPPGKEEEVRDGRRLMYVPQFRKKWYHDWQKLKANAPMWDDKVIYKHIGKVEGQPFDDVYMLTSVNHHIALLRMRVHPAYLAWLDTGSTVLAEEINGQRKDVLYVRRSTWYDMLNVDDRRDLLIVLWRLMCWLNRDNIDNAEIERVAQKRSTQ